MLNRDCPTESGAIMNQMWSKTDWCTSPSWRTAQKTPSATTIVLENLIRTVAVTRTVIPVRTTCWAAGRSVYSGCRLLLLLVELEHRVYTK